MDDLEKLEHLSLVARVATEMENHFGIGEKEVAEFVIDTAKRARTLEMFKRALVEQGLGEEVSVAVVCGYGLGYGPVKVWRANGVLDNPY